MRLLQDLLEEEFFADIRPEDKKNIVRVLCFILPILIFVLFWDKIILGAQMTPVYLLIKGANIFTMAAIIFSEKVRSKLSVWLFVLINLMFLYSFYGITSTHFTYCYSFLELYFVISFFFRFSKKSYITLMAIGGVLNIVGIYLAAEPEFIKEGMSFKPHITVVSMIIYFLSYLLFFNVTKKKEELFKLQEKFAIIGKQSSYIFHEIKKPINRLLQNDLENNDVQQISDIMLNIDLMLKDPNNFQRSFVHLNLKEVFERVRLEFSDYFTEYSIKFSYPEEDYNLLANRGLLHQVFKNLTINAIEAIVKTDPRLEKSAITISFTSEGQSRYIHFHNTGSSIPMSQKENIFNPFYSTKTTGNNHGLGLSFCRNILEGHAGQIKLAPDKTGVLFVLNFS